MDTLLEIGMFVVPGLLAWLAFDRSRMVSGGLAAISFAMALEAVAMWLPTEQRTTYYGETYESYSASAYYLSERASWFFFVGILLLLVGLCLLWARRARRVSAMDRSAVLESLSVPKNVTNSFAAAIRIRNEMHEKFLAICEKEDIKVISYVSPDHSSVVWMQLEFDLPKDTPTLSFRAIATIEVERFDFHRFEHVFRLKLQLGARTRVISGIISLDEEEIQNVCLYLKGQKELNLLFAKRVRSMFLQFWRPRNQVDRLRPDWIALGGTAGSVAALIIPVVGIPLAIGGMVALYFYLRSQKVYILTTGKPEFDPRILALIDTWQTSIAGLGGQSEAVRNAIINRLRASSQTEAKITTERIWYRGPDGKVERDQIVVCFRRALAYVHVEAYDENLFVSWDTHLNKAVWKEETLERGIDRETGKRVVANRVELGYLASNEYDVTDVTFLSEWVHSCVTKEVKLKLEENKIDQEIDFLIQRESRQAAMSDQGRGNSGGERKKGLLGAFKRIA